MPRAADGGGRVIPGFGAPAAPVPRLHLVSVVGGGESAMLGHLIAHYRHLGVESFRIIRHAESTAAPEFEAIKHYARAAGVELHRTYIGPLDNDVQGRLMSEAMAERPEDWYILADLDEFHLYDRPLDDLLELANTAATPMCADAMWIASQPTGPFGRSRTNRCGASFPSAERSRPA